MSDLEVEELATPRLDPDSTAERKEMCVVLSCWLGGDTVMQQETASQDTYTLRSHGTWENPQTGGL